LDTSKETETQKLRRQLGKFKGLTRGLERITRPPKTWQKRPPERLQNWMMKDLKW